MLFLYRKSLEVNKAGMTLTLRSFTGLFIVIVNIGAEWGWESRVISSTPSCSSRPPNEESGSLLAFMGWGVFFLGPSMPILVSRTRSTRGAVLEFFSKCPRKYRHLPMLCGIDANEVPQCIDNGDEGLEIGSCSTNLNVLVHEALRLGASPLAP